MSLATRCSACGTVFRVVQDQLKVSEGWVRCGRCSEVFNAHDALFDLERDRPPPWARMGDGDPAFDPAQADAAAAGLPEALAADASDPQLVDRIDAALFGSRGEPDEPGEPVASIEPPQLAPSTAPRGPAGVPPADIDSAAGWAEPAVDHDGAAASELAPIAAFEYAPGALDNRTEPRLGAAPPAAPAFLRDAERAERWKSSRARLVLALGCLLLLVVLAAQALYQFRDVLAARWPGARATFAAACGLLDCRIEAPRRIEDLSVESTTLTRAGGVDAFRLAVTLRNHGTLALAPPSIDLSLTDSTGSLVARRALAPADFRAPPGPLQPGAESAWQLLLSAGTPRVTGYTVEIFYP